MIGSLKKQPQIKILPVTGVDGRLKLGDTDLKELVRTVESVLPQYENSDIDVTITLLEKNLKIMADMTLMKECLTRLTKNAIDGLPGGAHFSQNIKQVNFEVQTFVDGFDVIAGACAFIYLTDSVAGIDEKIKETIATPFFTIKTESGQNLSLLIAYRIIKEPNKSIRGEDQWGQREANIYLPLTKPEIVNMMTIPLGVSKGA